MPARIPMTERQRAALLALPDTEAMVVQHHGLGAEDLAAIGIARTPATRLFDRLLEQLPDRIACRTMVVPSVICLTLI